jgi:hypothetical protein
MLRGNVSAISMSNNGCGVASQNVAAPGGSPQNNNAQNFVGGQNCPGASNGKIF